jgi:capsular exopolysaccharide synthesis family protein
MSTLVDPSGAVDPAHSLKLAEQQRPIAPYGQPLDDRREPADEDVIDLRQYWEVLMRRRVTVLTVLSVSLIVALIVTFLTTPIYRGSLLLQIEREASKVVEFENVTPEERGDTKDFYQTQYELLKSRTLARRVIDQLGLQASPTFAPKEPSVLSEAIAGLKQWLQGPAEEGQESAPDLEKQFLENLTISPVKNSRLVRIEYDSPSPEEAAAVSNALADNFVNTSLERRYEASSYAKTFLEERIVQAKANLEDSERRLVAYAREREIVNMEDKLATLMQRYEEMNTALVKAEGERIKAEAEYNEMLRQGSARSGQVIESKVIQTLKGRKSELEAEYQEKLRVFKPAYPKMQQLQKEIAQIDRDIAAESSSISGAAKTTFEAKAKEEAKLAARAQEAKDEILDMQDRSSDYQTLKREVETNRSLYDGLVQRMKEIGVVAGIGTNNIAVVDRAEVPQEKHKPSLKTNLAIAIALGLFGGVLLAFLLETLDDTIKSSADIEKRLGVPVLGLIPRVPAAELQAEDAQGLALHSFRDPKSAMAEAYRSLRTSLIFSTSEGAPRVLQVTSASPSEGKTTTAVSVATAFAQTGSTVLIIDCDLRNPSLHQAFVVPNTDGLTNYLVGEATPAEIAKPTQVARLFMIPSGPLPPNPVELLSGARMLDLISTAQQRFDYVILDGPPVIGLADALVISRLAQATVFVVAAGSTRIGAMEGSAKRLRAANAKLIGTVMIKVGKTGSGYGYGYDYHYSYSYGKPGQHKTLPEPASTEA